MFQFCVDSDINFFNKVEDNATQTYANIPRVNDCFRHTILNIVPAIFLVFFTPLVIYDFRKSRNGPLFRKNPTTIKMFTCSFLLLDVFIQLAYFFANWLVIGDIKQQLGSHAAHPLAQFISLLLLESSLLLALLLLMGSTKFGLISSGILFNYWLLLAVCGAPQFRTTIETFLGIEHEQDDVSSILFGIYYVNVLATLILSCFADRPKNLIITDKTCPEWYVSFINRITFWWFTPIAKLGNSRDLVFDDLWDLSEWDKSRYLVGKFEKNRDKQFTDYNKLKKNKAKMKLSTKDGIEEAELLQPNDKSNNEANTPGTQEQNPPSIIWALILTFEWNIVGAFLCKMIYDILQFVPPLLLDLIIRFMEEHEQTIWDGLGIAIAMFVISLIQSMFLHQYFHLVFRFGMNTRTILTSAVYKKALMLSNGARKDRTIGEIVNLMTVDIQKFQDIATWIFYCFSAPLQILLSLYFLWKLLGISIVTGVFVLVAFIPLNGKISIILRTMQQKQMALKDERIKLLNEMLSGIRVLKLYAWEQCIENRILEIRRKELENLKKMAFLNAISAMSWASAPFLVAVATFATYLLIDPAKNILTPRITFVAISYFNILRFPLAIFPMVTSSMVQCNVSNKRLKTFLASEEIETVSCGIANPEISIAAYNGNFSWDSKGPLILKDINMAIKRGSLVAIVGRIGSGKSSLLSAVLGEMYRKSGTIGIDGRVAYVPQQAWIQNLTLKENILFAAPMDLQRYGNVLDACALEQDLAALPGGDATEIGEKGINLSGGQKQRISLARAAYSDSDIYFFDDPLSAVDSHVGKHIFEKLISSDKGILRGKTRILVTHGLSFLKYCDQIIVIKDGQISESGSYQDLLKDSGEFSCLIEEYLQKTPDDVEEEEVLELGKINPEKQAKFGRQMSQKGEQSSKEENTVSTPHFASQEEKQESVRSQKQTNSQTDKNGDISAQTMNAADKMKIIEKEEIFTGKVKFRIYLSYLAAVSYTICAFFIIIYLGASVLGVACNIWLAKWTDNAKEIQTGDSLTPETIKRLLVYTLLGVSQAICVAFGTIVMSFGMIRAGRKLHQGMLSNILRNAMSWFDVTPLGRIMNRFGKDVDNLDNDIPRSFQSFLHTFFSSIQTIIMICYATPQFVVMVVPLAIFYGFVLRFYVSTSRQLKRLESTTRSPIYSYFGESVQGASSIRAYNSVDRFLAESQRRVDCNISCYFPSIVSNRWLAIRLELVGNLIVFFSAFSAVIFRDSDNITPGLVGLSVTYALSVTQTLNWAVRMTSELETNIVAVERIAEYTDPKANEAAIDTPREIQIGKKWPENGEILFENLALRYRPDLDLVLKGVTAKIKGREKIGIIGRTGAGKSSLTLALFRLVEPSSGRIIIDDLDITRVGLHDLRSRLTIVPQDPVIFSGTIRDNLDPFSRYDSADIWTALQLTHLDEFVKLLPDKLEHKINEGGGNLSVGQRQLICLARALLRQPKILILDEAAASVDIETDHLIQSTIRDQFKDCTVLTIAHRLHSVLDSDRLLVFSEGRIVEFDSPQHLFAQPGSLFRALALDAGIINVVAQQQPVATEEKQKSE